MTRSEVRLAPAERRAWRGLLALNAALLPRVARHLQRDSGLSTPEYEVLVNLDKAPDGQMRVLELANTMQWEKSRLSKQLARMADRGLLTREPCLTDQRGAVFALTDAGRRAFVEAEAVHLQHVRELFFDALDPDQLDTLGAITETITAHVEASDSRFDRSAAHRRCSRSAPSDASSP